MYHYKDNVTHIFHQYNSANMDYLNNILVCLDAHMRICVLVHTYVHYHTNNDPMYIKQNEGNITMNIAGNQVWFCSGKRIRETYNKEMKIVTCFISGNIFTTFKKRL
jgi:hypothetical protein